MGNCKDLASNSVYVVMLRGVSCLGGCLQFPNASSWLIIYFYCVCVCVCVCLFISFTVQVVNYLMWQLSFCIAALPNECYIYLLVIDVVWFFLFTRNLNTS